MLEALFGPACRLCGRRKLRSLGSVSPTHPAHFHVEEFRLQHCSGCDVVYLDPAPTPADLDALYRDSEQFSDPHYTDADQVARMLEFYGGSLKRHALLPRQGARLLEIGGTPGRVPLRLLRSAVAARQVDFVGETILELPVDNDKIMLDFGAFEFIEVEILWQR
jgi:hypothetical protein